MAAALGVQRLEAVEGEGVQECLLVAEVTRGSAVADAEVTGDLA